MRMADDYSEIARRLAELEQAKTDSINAKPIADIGEQVQYLGKRYLWDGSNWIEQAHEQS